MYIDPAQLAQAITPYLLPALPYLWNGVKTAGKEAAKGLGGEIGKKVPEAAIKLWDKIWDRAEKDAIAPIVIEKAAKQPEDEKSIKAFEKQLQSFLDDENFRMAVYELFELAKAEQPHLNIQMSIEKLHGEAVGLEVKDGDELRRAGIENIDINQNIDEVEKGGKLTGASFGKLR